MLIRPGSAFAVAKPGKRPGSAVAAAGGGAGPGRPKGSGSGSRGLAAQASEPTLSSEPTVSSVYIGGGGGEGEGDFGVVDAADAAAAARNAAEEEEARQMGAPKGSGRLARLVGPGEVFGERAVLRRGGGEARAATAVALERPVAILTLRKWAYDAILRAVVGPP